MAYQYFEQSFLQKLGFEKKEWRTNVDYTVRSRKIYDLGQSNVKLGPLSIYVLTRENILWGWEQNCVETDKRCLFCPITKDIWFASIIC